MLDYLYKYFYLMFKDQMADVKGDTPQNYSAYMLALGLIVWAGILCITVDVLLFTWGSEGYLEIEKWCKLYIFIVAAGLAVAFTFYYFMYRRYVRSGYYMLLYNNNLSETPGQILKGKIVPIACMFAPVLVIIVLFLSGRNTGHRL